MSAKAKREPALSRQAYVEVGQGSTIFPRLIKAKDAQLRLCRSHCPGVTADALQRFFRHLLNSNVHAFFPRSGIGRLADDGIHVFYVTFSVPVLPTKFVISRILF